MDFWNKVLFTDESKFNIFQYDGRIGVWRVANTKLEKININNNVKHGSGEVIVGLCMTASGDCVIDKTLYMILKEKSR